MCVYIYVQTNTYMYVYLGVCVYIERERERERARERERDREREKVDQRPLVDAVYKPARLRQAAKPLQSKHMAIECRKDERT